MENNFRSILAIDFETANAARSSACAVAAVKMDLSGNVIESYYSLINPHEEFDPFNIMIHGITPDDVVDSPSINPAMAKVFNLIDPDTLIVCHNSAFDFSVMKNSLSKEPLSIPDLTFTCTYRLSSRLISSLVSYTLPDVADYLQIGGLDHHNAMSDALTCGKILLRLASDFSGDFGQMHTAANLKYGHIVDGDYDGIHKINREHTGHISRLPKNFPDIITGEDSPFYQKNVCFTGKLESMTRIEAIDIINQIGGVGQDSFKKDTDYLITGYQSPSVLAGKPKSSKTLKAEEMLKKGKRIEIIPEDEFLKMLY